MPAGRVSRAYRISGTMAGGPGRGACQGRGEVAVDWTWVRRVIAALIVAIAKTSFGGLGSIAVALLAFVMPTKESTAAALLLLIVGDIVAVPRHRRPCCRSSASRRSPRWGCH
mgnify:CR=1 FL=1